MPWKQSGLMDERVRFVRAYSERLWSMTELCHAFGISRRTGYKWAGRFQTDGIAGLKDRSKAPWHSPQRTDPAVLERLIGIRQMHPSWGPRKILAWLLRRHPELEGVLPAPSTLGDLFRHRDLVKPRRVRGPRAYAVAGSLQTAAPNDVWTADFKGEFRLGNTRYCYPFTLADAHSRYLLACEVGTGTTLVAARTGCLKAFRANGLPQAIRTDNGTPFVGQGASGLSALSVWWIQLGIRHQRIPKGRPDQNGRHERMHRTLKAETTRPPERSLKAQQHRFDAFRREFNEERPHEALNQETPASRYQNSPRAYPERIPSPEYPGYFEPRKLNRMGGFKFRGRSYFVAQPMAGEWVGLVEIEDDLWSVRYYDHEIGRITPKDGDLVIKVLPMSPV